MHPTTPGPAPLSPVAHPAGEGLYRLLVESVHDYAVFALDREGRVVTWNPGAERFKGYRADQIIGQPACSQANRT